MLGAAFWVGAYLMARAAPVTYLRVVSRIELAPISVSWALEQAKSDLTAGNYDSCEELVLFAWYGSFGGGPVLPDDLKVPDTVGFEEVVLFRSGTVYESTKDAVAKMAIFNETVLTECLTENQN